MKQEVNNASFLPPEVFKGPVIAASPPTEKEKFSNNEADSSFASNLLKNLSNY